MFVYCEECGYDSQDRGTREELAEKVRADGGEWQDTGRGVYIRCPNGHDGDSVRID